MTFPFSVFDSEGLLLQRKTDQNIKMNDFECLLTYEREICGKL
ncbi:MAG: hypothetical protein H6Q41_593 [Deltaproteobacteria bacterium]|nr:hypothetical protein [Deltaproteobacteria bacterium]